jgi:hypothetical protein
MSWQMAAARKRGCSGKRWRESNSLAAESDFLAVCEAMA